MGLVLPVEIACPYCGTKKVCPSSAVVTSSYDFYCRGCGAHIHISLSNGGLVAMPSPGPIRTEYP